MGASFSIILSVWPQVLIGLVLLVPAVGVGWCIGDVARWRPVRFLHWWLDRVILPKLRKRLWITRALTIFVNNTIVLALVLLGGFALATSVLMIVVMSISLGVGFKKLAAEPLGDGTDQAIEGASPGKVRFGMALNMLEPPAILAVIGLSLAQTMHPVDASLIWTSYLAWIVPLLAVAAGGEALWLGEVYSNQRAESKK
jgi:hypothetical protein